MERIGEAKERDGRRQSTVELFTTWWDRHADHPVAVRDLHVDVRRLVDPQDRSRQYASAQLEKLAGTRIAGLVLMRQAAAGKWGVATYAMKTADGPGGHRDHRGHPVAPATPGPDSAGAPFPAKHEDQQSARPIEPMPPMVPMPFDSRDQFGRSDPWTGEDWQAAFDERAGIMEFDGGLPRAKAEANAAEDVAHLLPALDTDHD